MKRPNNLFQKKYISSLVIAAFLILSVLTAYNIKIGNADGRKSDNKTKTENTEKSNDVIGPVSGSDTDSAAGSASDSTENNDMDAEWGEETNDKTETNDRAVTEKEDSDEQKDEQTTDRERSGSGIESSDAVYNYNGRKKLTWPVMGNIILPYSMEVVSPGNGRIVNIEDTDRYGKMVTILLGNYYKAYCGQLENVDYEIGDDIQEGDVIGTVAEPTRSFVLEGPNVFFKMTYKGKAVNPVKYLRS